MKLQALASAVLFAVAFPLSVAANAADADKAPPAEAKPAPHSHLQEKMGIAPKAAEATEQKSDKDKAPKKSKKKHSHPTDAK